MTAPTPKKAAGSPAPWTFLTNHAHVLILLALEPALRIQEVADRVGITYRAVQRILGELEAEGYLARRRQEGDARSNEYRVGLDLPLRHPVERHRTVAMLVELGRGMGEGAGAAILPAAGARARRR